MQSCELILKATNFAALKHSFQRRKDPESTPYINHPIGVAWILMHEGNVTDPIVLQAALLHDTLEDTDTTYEELVEHFGVAVAKVVQEVSDDKNLPKERRKELQIEHAPHVSFAAKNVKLGDKLYNLRDLDRVPPVGWTSQRVQEYFLWASKVVHGIRGTNPNLEKKLDELFTKYGVI